MITITPQAADQIRKSTEHSQAQGMALRIAARLGDDGVIEYGMGFDHKAAGDLQFNLQGIELLVAEGARELLDGATLDYVELNPGEHHLIFINPNDPSHATPAGGKSPKKN